MKVYKWEGKGFFLGAVVIVIADCMLSAKEMIEKELIDGGLARSWEESQEVEEFDLDDCKVIFVDSGDY